MKQILACQDVPSPTGAVNVTETSDPHELLEVFAFRARTWRAVGGLSPEAFAEGQWRDAQDEQARHWVARDETGRLLAAGRLSIHPSLNEVLESHEYLRYGLRLEGPIAAPDRVVVCPSAQGLGLGRRMLDVQDTAARGAGARYAVRQASPAMVRLLTHRGWKILGPANRDPRFPGVDFQVALLDLANQKPEA